MDELVFLESNCLEEIPFTTSEVISEGMGHVYCIDNGTGNVKIGRTINPKRRIETIESQSGIKIKQAYLSPLCSNYGEIENLMHENFKEYRQIGEWFNIKIEDTINYLNIQNFKTEPLRTTDSCTQLWSNNTTLIDLETEILDGLAQRMNLIRDEVIISNAKYGNITKQLRKRVFKIMTLYDNFEKDFRDQIAVLMELGNDYQFIKMVLTKKYLIAI